MKLVWIKNAETFVTIMYQMRFTIAQELLLISSVLINISMETSSKTKIADFRPFKSFPNCIVRYRN